MLVFFIDRDQVLFARVVDEGLKTHLPHGLLHLLDLVLGDWTVFSA